MSPVQADDVPRLQQAPAGSKETGHRTQKTAVVDCTSNKLNPK